MTIRNPWVGYLDRNYQTIKSKILNRLGETIPEMTDHSDSNILVVIIESFSGVAEMLSYYIDNMSREAFITTARRYSSVVKHTRLIDYRIKAIIPSSVDIQVYLYNNDDSIYTLPTSITIPIGTSFRTANNVEFLTNSDVVVPIGASVITLPCKQRTLVENENLGNTNNDANQTVNIGREYVDSTAELTIDGEVWLLQNTLGLSGPTDKHFIIEISADKEAYIRFGDNINGAIPLPGLPIVLNYYTSQGALGNVEPFTINTSPYNFTSLHGIPKVVIQNNLKSVGGTDYESIERIRRSAPLSLRTLDRAVTRKDYIDLALLAPGVDKASLYFECGKYIDLYVSPNGGGIASSSLLTDVVNYFESRKMITTFVRALPAGESELVLNLDVTGKFRVNGLQLRNELITLLTDAYSYTNSDINKKIRTSDVISLVDNYSKVDFLQLIDMYVKPYIRPRKNNTLALNYNIDIKAGSIEPVNWTLSFDGLYVRLMKNYQVITNLTIGVPYTDPFNIITITILAGSYVTGMEWEFTSLPRKGDILLNDFSVPVLTEGNLTLNINEQLAL